MSLCSRLLPALLLAVLVTFGCGGEPPDKEMQQAQGALDAARAAGADQYAAEEFTAATLALTNANAAVEQRDYRLALNHALDSRERAQNAAKLAADGKAAARTDADRALTAAEKALADVSGRLVDAESRKVPDQLLAGPRRTLDTAHAQLQEARASFGKGEYLGIPAKVASVTASLPAVSAELDAAAAPAARRRR